MSPRRQVRSLLDIAITSLKKLVCNEALKVVKFIRKEIFACAGRHNKVCIEEIPEIITVWQKLQTKINQHVDLLKVRSESQLHQSCWLFYHKYVFLGYISKPYSIASWAD
jgi:hypothetical protein